MSFFENTRKPVGLGGKIMVAMMNVGHSAMAAWGLRFLQPAPDAMVLDCGCGGGANIKTLLKLCPKGKVQGIDYSAVSVEKARKVNAGPLIQYSKVELDENNEPDINMQFMLQANNFIHNVEQPYRMESLLRVRNCLYARYNGPEDKLKFAYDKLGVYAFENDIELDGCNYTIYVDRNEEEETMVADVFMPVKE